MFLEKLYAKNVFLVSGRRDNRVGGVIIGSARSQRNNGTRPIL